MYIDAFLAEAVAAYRAQLARGDAGDRRAAEDAIALLTDYRLAGIDERGLELLFARMIAGRSTVTMLSSQPAAVAADLMDRWQAYRQTAHAGARA